jgi:hypothetical protein
MREFRTKNFSVICQAFPEEDLDISWDDSGEVAKGLDDGELIAFVAHVAVYYHGDKVGEAYLGNCVYKSLEDFMDHRECGQQNREYEARGERGRCGSYFHDMIREACQEARKTIAQYREVRVRTSSLSR